MSDLHLEGNPRYRPRPAPDAELLVLADAAHILCAERADAFNAALLAFLES